MNVRQHYEAAWRDLRVDMPSSQHMSWDDYFVAHGQFGEAAWECYHRRRNTDFTGWLRGWRRDRWMHIRGGEDPLYKIPF